MAILGIGEKKKTELSTYAPGRTYDPKKSVMGGTWEDLYNSEANITNIDPNSKNQYSYKVKVDQSMIDLTPEQQLAIKNNKNMKDTQNRLKTQGVGQQQSVLGGGGY